MLRNYMFELHSYVLFALPIHYCMMMSSTRLCRGMLEGEIPSDEEKDDSEHSMLHVSCYIVLVSAEVAVRVE
jgi:hypothetical protein